MPGPEAWQAFGGVAVVVVLLGALAVALQRLGVLRPRAGAAKPAASADGDRLDRLERDLTTLRLGLAETYVRRDDYVPQLSLILAKLDAQAALLARLDERTRQWEGRE